FLAGPAPTETYTLSLHDALPISARAPGWAGAVKSLFENDTYRRLKEADVFNSGAAQAGIEIAAGEVVSRDEALRMLQTGFGSGMRAAVADVEDMVAPDLRLVPRVE